jgi:hypothetical protein
MSEAFFDCGHTLVIGGLMGMMDGGMGGMMGGMFGVMLQFLYRGSDLIRVTRPITQMMNITRLSR